MSAKKPLTAEVIATTSRRLTNPAVRVQLRRDFPNMIAMAETALLPRIEAELAKQGHTLASVGEINMICPQKDPDAHPGHHDPAVAVLRVAAKKLQAEMAVRRLGRSAPKIIQHDAIGELVHLDRSSGRGGIFHSLTRQQVFNVNAARHARHPTSFLAADTAPRPHYFVIVDWHISQGTTVANLASYITHNGGHVLAIASLFNNRNLLPAGQKMQLSELPDHFDWLAPEFAQSASGAQAMAAIGYLLAKSAIEKGHQNIKVNGVLADVERALNRHGHSLKALTHDEAYRLYDHARSGYLNYDAMMALNTRKPEEGALLRKLAR